MDAVAMFLGYWFMFMLSLIFCICATLYIVTRLPGWVIAVKAALIRSIDRIKRGKSHV